MARIELHPADRAGTRGDADAGGFGRGPSAGRVGVARHRRRARSSGGDSTPLILGVGAIVIIGVVAVLLVAASLGRDGDEEA